MLARMHTLGSLEWRRPRRAWRRLAERLAEADLRYRQRLHLEHLDEHMLRDIGLTRADIRAEILRLRGER